MEYAKEIEDPENRRVSFVEKERRERERELTFFISLISSAMSMR